MAQWLTQRLGQSFVIENRAGAGTNIAADAVAHAAPDGYTLLLAASPNAINVTLYDKLNFDFMRDIVPVAAIERAPLLMAVNPAFPAKTAPEFIAYAKANPGKVNQGSGGIGSTGHVAGELFKMMAGIEMAHVPYRGEPPALTDLIGGRVQVVFSTAGSLVGYMKAGTLRALGVTTKTELPALAGVPLLADAVPGYDAASWVGIAAPRRTPPDIVATLNREINAGLADAKLRGQLADLGAAAFSASPGEFEAFIAAEVDKWRKVVKTAGLKPE
jgi:tripartite-type tricarboxylate transporter receptor subunit TctC